MAVGAQSMKVQYLERFRLVAADAQRLAEFYQRALDFQLVAAPDRVAAASADEAGKTLAVALALGDQTVELLQFESPGLAYPVEVASSDVAFQHLALVVSDMDAAYAQLQSARGWTPISTNGPEKLPAASGGVTAFKFRDPEGHPLELLYFPPDQISDHWKQRTAAGVFLGIDHSAISVADAARSVAFYQSLGFSVAHRSTNRGVEQGRLDDLGDPVVEVIAMKPPGSPPHVELLGYRQGEGQPPLQLRPNDVAATSLVFSAEADDPAASARHLQDPDGHRSLIEPESG